MHKLFKILIIVFIYTANHTNAQLSFTTAVNYTAGANPQCITSADFNNDGKSDLAEVNGTSNDLYIYLGSGTGTFTAFATYSVGNYPRSVISTDFNGDGNTDLAVANYNDNNISILIGSGTGTFTTAVNYTVGINPRALISADFNNDGKSDLAVANYGSNNTSVLFGTGLGTFSVPVNYSVGTSPWAINFADFNNDGNADLVVVNGLSSDISVLLGSSTGTFAPSVNYLVSVNPRSVTIADFNGDGNTDLATSNISTFGDVSILLGSPTGTFAPAVSYLAGSTFPLSVIAVDLNGDGKIDLATSNSSTNDVSILLGSGTGTFSTAVPFAVGTQPNSITSSDFNGDGKPDLATSNNGSNNLSVLLNTSISLSVPTASFSISNPKCVGSAITFSDQSTYFPTVWAWTFPGGSPTSSIIKNPSITYSASGTYSAILTASNSIGPSIALTKTFVITSPTITVNSGAICSGKSFTIIPSGASTYTFSGGTTIVTPTINTTYSVTGTNSIGCISSNTAVSSVTVNPLPTLSVNSGSICYGTTFTIVPSGASTYTYSGGSAMVTPTLNTTYSVTGTNTSGCISTIPAISNVTVNASTFITGMVTNTASIPVAGLVTLYLNETGFTKYDSITSIAISGSGAFTFTNAINANKYLIKAIPTATNYIVTYGNSSSTWMAATTMIHGCMTTSTANITVLDLTPITAGIGSLSGKIEKGPGYGLRTNEAKPLSTPIKGIIVKGGRNPGGNIVAQTTTDANGTYTLSGLSNDNYFILVDIPGLDTNTTYHKVLVAGSEVYTNLDFTVDSTKINPINLTVGMQEINISNNNISIFPNPTSNILNIQYTLTQSSEVKFELYDLIGKSVKTIVDLNNQLNNTYETSVSLSDLDSGIYFIKITLNKEEQIVKICISK
jgi:hypothetical protein